MTKHQKRLSVPKSWPVERKTETYTVKARAGPHGEDGVPLLVLLRDVLGAVDSRKEARYALDNDSVLVNGDAVSDEARPIGMFDILAFEEREEYFRVFPDEGGRLALTPINAGSAGSKLSKIEDKTQVSGDEVQLNLHDGANLAVDEGEYGTGDSVVIDNDDGSIVAHFPYEEGALVTAVRGQHAGDIGRIDTIQVTPGSADNNVVVETADGSFETVEDYVVVIDENFVEDESVLPGSDAEATDADDAEADEDDEAEADAETDDDAGADEDDAAEADDDGSETDDGGDDG